MINTPGFKFFRRRLYPATTLGFLGALAAGFAGGGIAWWRLRPIHCYPQANKSTGAAVRTIKSVMA
jgi:hypothetical protein